MRKDDIFGRRPLPGYTLMFIIGIIVGEKLNQIFFIKEHPILLISLIGCFYFICMGKFRGKRRIYLNLFVVGLIIILFTNLRYEINKFGNGKAINVVGRVVSVEEGEEDIQIIVRPLNYYENIYGNILLNAYDVDVAEKIKAYSFLGDIVNVRVNISTPNSSGNPRSFDYREYLYGRGISGVGTVKFNEIEKSKDAGGLFHIKKNLILYREKYLNYVFSEEESRNLAGGILFGKSRGISDEVREEFYAGGTGHILAVSGLHIGIIYMFLEKIRKIIISSVIKFLFRIKNKRKVKTEVERGIEEEIREKIKAEVKVEAGVKSNFFKGKRVSDYLRIFPILILMPVYGTLSMWSPSVTRAIMMVMLKEISILLNKRFDGLSALSGISFIMLIHRPYLVFSLGFQMTFLAVMGVYFILPKLNNILISVQLLMIPYTIYSYGRISVTSILVNYLLVMITGIYVPIGVISFFILSVGKLTENIMTLLGKIIIEANSLFLLGGRSVIENIYLSFPAIIVIIFSICYFFSEFFIVERERKGKRAYVKLLKIGVALYFIGCIIDFTPFDYADQIFIDVGQGDSVHVNWEDTDILIDGGGRYNYNVGENILKPYLLKSGTKDIDMAITTHMHMDHYKGIEELDEVYPIGEVINAGKAGDRISLSESRYIDILWPIPGYENSSDENYYSRIFMINDRGVRTLITGDITEDGERALISYYKGTDALNCHILKIAHHGSKYSTTQEFLDVTTPEVAVISVGKNNYGHPSASVIEKLEEQGIIVYRTDKDGAIGVIIDKNGFWICGNRRNMRIERYSLT